MQYHYNSLEDFLATNPLSVDAQVDDGWGAFFPVKGREIDASILFSDISGFSKRTLDLSPTETLIFVNHFFAWISAEALRGRPGIVDKYIGDEIMIVFSKEFGSDDPFVDAVQTARCMCGRMLGPSIRTSASPVALLRSGMSERQSGTIALSSEPPLLLLPDALPSNPKRGIMVAAAWCFLPRSGAAGL